MNPLSLGYWRLLHFICGHRRTVRSRGLTFSLQCNNPVTYYRWESYNTKEPETLDWIDRHVRDGSTLFDIGANIGLYSIYAALRHPKTRVIAFEPEYANLHYLRDNVFENGLMDRVVTYPLALSDRCGPSMLHVQDVTPGAALATEADHSLTATRTGHRVVAREGAYAITLDEFCGQTGIQPDCIKIDVDGTEPEILAGGRSTLSAPALRSVIIEMPERESDRQACACRLSEAGLNRVWHATGVANEIWIRDGEGV